MTSEIAAVVEAVQRSRRYQAIAPEVVARLAAEELPKSRNAADAQKRTKRRLHQIFGAYTQPLPYAQIAARLATLTAPAPECSEPHAPDRPQPHSPDRPIPRAPERLDAALDRPPDLADLEGRSSAPSRPPDLADLEGRSSAPDRPNPHAPERLAAALDRPPAPTGIEGRNAAPTRAAELEALCRWVLGLHASTRERLPLLETLYAQIFAITGRPARLVDIACGLHPFAWPWMGLDASTTYIASDIDRQLVDLVDLLLTTVGVPHAASVADALAVTPPPADVALLLKTLPPLEQQRPGVGLQLLDRLTARHVVVSYPTQSLAGRAKGMARTYRAQCRAMLDQRPTWSVHELEFRSELVFVIDKRP